MDATALLKNAPWIFSLALVGVAGFAILLAVGLNLYRQERKPPAPDAPRAGWQLPGFLRRLIQRRPPADPAAPDGPAGGGAAAKPEAVAPPEASAASATIAGGIEVLRVLRHPLTGRLLVEIAGRRYTAAAEITDAEVRAGLHVTLRDLQRFSGEAPAADSSQPGLSPAAPSSTQPSTPPAEPLPAEPGGEPPSAPATPEPPPGTGPALNPLPPTRPAAPPTSQAPLRLPSMNPFRQMQVLRELGTQEPAAPKSIAEQIDEVLQQLIAGTPYEARGLRVRIGPRDSVLFGVGDQNYAGLEAVPDETVRAVFREAIRQWETRS